MLYSDHIFCQMPNIFLFFFLSSFINYSMHDEFLISTTTDMLKALLYFVMFSSPGPFVDQMSTWDDHLASIVDLLVYSVTFHILYSEIARENVTVMLLLIRFFFVAFCLAEISNILNLLRNHIV